MKPEIKYGLITGALVCAWILVEYQLGFHSTHVAWGAFSGYLSNLIPLTTLYLLLRNKRARLPNKDLSIRQGVNSGVFASLVAALIVYSFSVAYHQLINPVWIDQMLDWKVALMREAGKTEPEVREMILDYRKAYSPTGLISGVLATMTLMGGIYALGITLVFQVLPRSAPAR